MNANRRPDGRLLTYRPALDGLRAISVLGVMAYHGLVPWLPGGFLGVDVFFVLSGFLITSLLVQEWKRWHHIDLVTFWAHRARRLLPALLVVVALTCVAAWRLEPPEKLATVRGDALATLFYVANWRFILKDQSYFEQYGDPSPFRHMWSLGIEEQYYLLFPLILLGLLTVLRRQRRALWLLLALGALGSAALMAVQFDPAGDPSRIYYGTDTRAQELLVGATAAMLVQLPPRLLRDRAVPRVVWEAMALLGMAAVVGAMLVAHDTDPWLYRGGFLGLSVLTALLIVVAGRGEPTLVTWVLGQRPLVAIGVISYGLYLWHWPVDVFLSPFRTGLDGNTLLALRTGVALAGALASYFLLERPIRRGAIGRLARLPRRAAVVAPLPVAALVVLAATASAVAPAASRWSLPPSAQTGDKPHLAVVGDSVAATVAQGVTDEVNERYRVTDHSTLGCGLGPKQLAVGGRTGPEYAQCDESVTEIGDALDQDPADATVMFFGAWETVDHVVDDKTLKVGSQRYARYLEALLDDEIAAVAPDDQPVLIANVPCYHDTSVTGDLADIAHARNSEDRQAAVNAVLTEVKAQHDNVTVLDLRTFLCSGPDGGEDLDVRYDGVHFTPEGADTLWTWMLPQVDQALEASGGPVDSGGVVRAMLLGDSVPYGLIADYPADARGDLVPLDGTKLGCGLLPEATFVDGHVSSDQPDDCAAHADELDARVDSLQPDVGVVFLGIGEQFDREVGDTVVPFKSEEYAAWLRDQVESRLSLFSSRGIPVALVNIPCHRVPDIGLAPQPKVINDEERIAWTNAIAADIVAGHPEVQLLDLHGFLCQDGYQNEVDDLTLRYDGMHFTPDGAAYVWRWLVPQLSEAARQPS